MDIPFDMSNLLVTHIATKMNDACKVGQIRVGLINNFTTQNSKKTQPILKSI